MATKCFDIYINVDRECNDNKFTLIKMNSSVYKFTLQKYSIGSEYVIYEGPDLLQLASLIKNIDYANNNWIDLYDEDKKKKLIMEILYHWFN
ncbi:MAG: hypothetical protein Terrestrivirus1_289 [Terrestrivirus sp.]|uniref:Uncharacterized protein n=1 Tax=Terrestrivirus sp. TaxID=2487775 RepID=A0A3G4ZKP8_9VIRU|nr:MAG: hypothetical protein Terrestrivirus1_289 [Terrestrivirus sp.]